MTTGLATEVGVYDDSNLSTSQFALDDSGGYQPGLRFVTEHFTGPVVASFAYPDGSDQQDMVTGFTSPVSHSVVDGYVGWVDATGIYPGVDFGPTVYEVRVMPIDGTMPNDVSSGTIVALPTITPTAFVCAAATTGFHTPGDFTEFGKIVGNPATGKFYLLAIDNYIEGFSPSDCVFTATVHTRTWIIYEIDPTDASFSATPIAVHDAIANTGDKELDINQMAVTPDGVVWGRTQSGVGQTPQGRGFWNFDPGTSGFVEDLSGGAANLTNRPVIGTPNNTILYEATSPYFTDREADEAFTKTTRALGDVDFPDTPFWNSDFTVMGWLDGTDGSHTAIMQFGARGGWVIGRVGWTG